MFKRELFQPEHDALRDMVGRFIAKEIGIEAMVDRIWDGSCEYLTGQTIAIDGGHHLAAPSTFAALGRLAPADWARAKAIVRARAEKEKQQRSTG
jgi:hypothetical protein